MSGKNGAMWQHTWHKFYTFLHEKAGSTRAAHQKGDRSDLALRFGMSIYQIDRVAIPSSVTWSASRMLTGHAVLKLKEITTFNDGFDNFKSLMQLNGEVKALASSLATHTLRFKFDTTSAGADMIQTIGSSNVAALTSIYVEVLRSVTGADILWWSQVIGSVKLILEGRLGVIRNGPGA
ncbi:hypothetical protein PENSPDRAFT_695356 [Peniophora sp. CONT]|nr:hypothetical protein PENSPDRAFT_695356 [Peniophora sp. CONT]